MPWLLLIIALRFSCVERKFGKTSKKKKKKKKKKTKKKKKN